MGHVKLFAAAGFGLVATSAMAADATFENHLTSSPMVSPAQIYQVQDMRTDFAVGYQSAEGETKPDTGDKDTFEASGPRIFAAGVFNVRAVGLRAGLTVDHRSQSYENKLGSTKTGEGDASWTRFSPQAAMPVGPVVLATAVDVNQMTVEADGADEEAKATFMQVRPAVLFADGPIEAGLAYETRRKTNPEKADELPIAVPAATTLHGRFAVDRDLAFGAIFRQEQHQGLDKDAYKARNSMKATGEVGLGAVKVEGDVGYNMAYAKEDKLMQEDSIGTFELGAAADYEVTKAATVGGALAYAFGSDENTDTKQEFATNDLSFLVRGDMKF